MLWWHDRTKSVTIWNDNFWFYAMSWAEQYWRIDRMMKTEVFVMEWSLMETVIFIPWELYLHDDKQNKKVTKNGEKLKRIPSNQTNVSRINMVELVLLILKYKPLNAQKKREFSFISIMMWTMILWISLHVVRFSFFKIS